MKVLTSTVFLALFVSSFMSELPISASENVDHKELPLIAPAPIGPLLSIGLNEIYSSYRLMGGKSSEISFAETSKAASLMSSEEWKEFEKTVIEHSLAAVEFLKPSFDISQPIIDVSGEFNYLCMASSNRSRCMFNDISPTYQKNGILGPSSDYRYEVNRFVNAILVDSKKRSFFELLDDILRDFKEKRKASGKSNSLSSTNVLGFYMVVAKILTDTCSHIQAAYAIRYQELMTAKDVQNAERLKGASFGITQEYLSDMKKLMSITKSMLKSSLTVIQKSELTECMYEAAFQYNFQDDCSFDIRNPNSRFSLKSVDAPPGYVVTGMRWRFKLNGNLKIAYMQLQVGKFVDGTRVDRRTMRWLDMNDSDETVRSSDIKKVSLWTGELELGRYVTGVQMVFTDKGHLQWSMKSSGTNQYGTKLSGEIAQHFQNVSDLVNPPTQHMVFRLDDMITEPPSPINGFKISRMEFSSLKPTYGIIKLLPYISDYEYMIDDGKFEKYAKLFESK